VTAHAPGVADSAALLRFWFEEAGPARWYTIDLAFDAALRQRFSSLYAAAEAGALDDWEAESDGALALVLALDQLPRNLFRGTARAFATDPAARGVADRALARGFDTVQPSTRRCFFYLPFEHSESLADQDRAVALFEAIRLQEPAGYDYALQHREIIERFGRFPHRNAALGRPTTPIEAAFLQEFAGF
jgi:uncharacterized protein (DUF924 family)